jgi:thiamine-phosphate pyrophosphorylase
MGQTGFQLHLITERLGDEAVWLPKLRAASTGGVDWVQLRDRSLAALDLYRQVEALQAGWAESSSPGRRARLSVNDRIDVALAAGADGVHLAGRSLPVSEAVRLTEGRLLVGRSVHGIDEARRAAEDGADYLTFGHVFPTRSKLGEPPRGPEQLAMVVDAVQIPVLAIGGITLGNLEQVLATGCAGIAVISAILAADDPGLAARNLRAALDASGFRPRNVFPDAPRAASRPAVTAL